MGTKTRIAMFLLGGTAVLLSNSWVQAGTMVRFETVLGPFEVELFDETTPITVANFLGIVTRKDYDNTFIHRSVPGFVIQGGGYQATVPEVPDIPSVPPILNEPGISNTRGTIAMAKTAAGPDTATTQWFVNLADNSFLDAEEAGAFTVFGTIVGNGMEVVDAIAALPRVDAGVPFNELPVIDFPGGTIQNQHLVIISSVQVVADPEPPDPGPGQNAFTFYFAQFGNGGGLVSQLVLTNPSSTSTVSGQVNFLDDEGLPLEIGIAGVGRGGPPAAEHIAAQVGSSVEFSIPPLGDVTLSTDGQGQSALVGSAVINSDGNLAGIIRFTIPDVGVTGVGVSAPVAGFVAPVRRKTGGISTGVAMHNPESTPITLELTLRDMAGQTVPNGTRTIQGLAAGGHLAQFIGGLGEVLFPEADTDDFVGTLVVRVTDGTVAATALELGTQPGQFTTLPVTPLE